MELFYFILGFVAASYIAPILDGIGSLILGWIEVKKAQMSEKISLIEIKLRKAAEESEERPMRQIGFCVSDEEVYPEEENDDEI